MQWNRPISYHYLGLKRPRPAKYLTEAIFLQDSATQIKAQSKRRMMLSDKKKVEAKDPVGLLALFA